MPVDVLTTIEIDRPCAHVSAYAGDPSNAPDWYVNIKAVEWKTPPPLALGSRLAFVAHFLGRRLAYTYEIVEYEPGARLVMRTAEGPFPMETIYTWEAVGPARTRMTLRNCGEPRGFSRLAAPMMAAAMRRANRKDLARLKSVLEVSHLHAVKTYYQRELAQRWGKPVGCGEAEIEALEVALRHPLPSAYREYLLWMGNDVRGALEGTACFARDVVGNNEWLPQLLTENQIEREFPRPVVVWFGHQGYMASWFELPAASEDPPCYYFSEGEGMAAPEVRGSFSDVLLAAGFLHEAPSGRRT